MRHFVVNHVSKIKGTIVLIFAREMGIVSRQFSKGMQELFGVHSGV